jgi:xanthine dehydrogenase accessory factor
VQEPVQDAQWMRQLLACTAAHQLVTRELNLLSGQVQLLPAQPGPALQFDGQRLCTVWGPQWRLLLIGAGQLSQVVAQMAQLIDFEVLVCDPRDEYAAAPGVDSFMRRLDGMPDDVVRALQPDAHMAIVALTHDPKLDDMALLEALQSDAFYVGALGSQRNQAARRQRLAQHFGLTEQQLDRLHGPVGLALGGKTPAEIAVAIVAELVQFKNRQPTEVARPSRALS